MRTLPTTTRPLSCQRLAGSIQYVRFGVWNATHPSPQGRDYSGEHHHVAHLPPPPGAAKSAESPLWIALTDRR